MASGYVGSKKYPGLLDINQRTLGLLADTWPGRLVQGLLGGMAAPHDAYTGQMPVMDPNTGYPTPEAIGRSADLAGFTTLGAGAMPAEANSVRMGIKAYHGSPHDFNQFDMSKIGTGEGVQTFGHGLYFSEAPGVAQSYRDSLSNAQLFVDGNKVGEVGALGTDPIANAANALEHHGNDPKLAKAFVADRVAAAKRGGYGYSQQMAWSINDAIDGLVGKQIERRPGGKTYEVSINAHPDEFLDWDKPLSEQPKAVQDAVRGLIQPTTFSAKQVTMRGYDQPQWHVVDNFGHAYESWGTEAQANQRADWYRKGRYSEAEQVRRKTEMPGQALLRDLEKLGDPTAAAEALRAAGIKGIRYADQGSRVDPAELKTWRAAIADYRARGLTDKLKAAEARVAQLENDANRTSNYVVFSADNIDILKKYGIAGLTAAGAGATASQVFPNGRTTTGQPLTNQTVY